MEYGVRGRTKEEQGIDERGANEGVSENVWKGGGRGGGRKGGKGSGVTATNGLHP